MLGQNCSFAHAKTLSGTPSPPDKLAPIRTSGNKADDKGEGDQSPTDKATKTAAAEPSPKGKAQASPKKVGCLTRVPRASSAATLAIIAAAASSVIQPASSVIPMQPDSCFHVSPDVNGCIINDFLVSDAQVFRFRRQLPDPG